MEPLLALVALFAVGLGLSLYAGVLDTALGTTSGERNRAVATADVVEQSITDAGVVAPGELDDALAALPERFSYRLSLRVDETWSAGGEPPAGADRTTRTVSVRVGPGQLRRGRLRVVVWR